MIAYRQTDIQTDRHAHHNTPLPYPEWSKIDKDRTVVAAVVTHVPDRLTHTIIAILRSTAVGRVRINYTCYNLYLKLDRQIDVVKQSNRKSGSIDQIVS